MDDSLLLSSRGRNGYEQENWWFYTKDKVITWEKLNEMFLQLKKLYVGRIAKAAKKYTPLEDAEFDEKRKSACIYLVNHVDEEFGIFYREYATTLMHMHDQEKLHLIKNRNEGSSSLDRPDEKELMSSMRFYTEGRPLNEMKKRKMNDFAKQVMGDTEDAYFAILNIITDIVVHIQQPSSSSPVRCLIDSVFQSWASSEACEFILDCFTNGNDPLNFKAWHLRERFFMNRCLDDRSKEAVLMKVMEDRMERCRCIEGGLNETFLRGIHERLGFLQRKFHKTDEMDKDLQDLINIFKNSFATGLQMCEKCEKKICLGWCVMEG
jgi:hypothetical protein